MPSLFWPLLTWGILAPFLLRITLGAVVLRFAWVRYRSPAGQQSDKAVAALQAAVGALLVIGLWTQAAALAAAIMLVVALVGRIRNKAFLTDGVNYYLILFVIALSLLVTGAGAFAFDLPL